MTNTIQGIEILTQIYKNNKLKSAKEEIENKLNDFLKNEIFNIGPCHGDFHSKNILQNIQNKAFLIDYDCFRSNSIQELDAVYFIVQKIIDDNQGIWWHEAIENFNEIYLHNKKIYKDFLNIFIKQDINKLTLLYFIDRLGQDFKYDKSIKNLNQKLIINITQKLLKKFYATNNS